MVVCPKEHTAEEVVCHKQRVQKNGMKRRGRKSREGCQRSTSPTIKKGNCNSSKTAKALRTPDLKRHASSRSERRRKKEKRTGNEPARGNCDDDGDDAEAEVERGSAEMLRWLLGSVYFNQPRGEEIRVSVRLLEVKSRGLEGELHQLSQAGAELSPILGKVGISELSLLPHTDPVPVPI